MSIFLLVAAQAVPLSDPQPILVTASRTPIEAQNSAVSATVIDEQRIEALGASQTVDLLRLSPGLSISVTGARGTQAQVRIRGSEANHALLFIDGIAFNNPASGNEPRFEDLTADGLSRIDIVRGPQSALWGSEAIGGVIALDSPDPLGGTNLSLMSEYGTHDSLRGAFAGRFGDRDKGITLTVSHADSDGIDIVGGGTGDRDGYRNDTIAMLARFAPGSIGEIGLAARYIDARSEFDGFDPVTFLRADTSDNSQSETLGLRAWAALGRDPELPWSGKVEAQYLTGDNRNLLARMPLNRSSGDRFRVSGQLERRITLGKTHHSVIAAVEREDENFRARDQQYFGATDQDRDRGRMAFVGEWRAEWDEILSTDIAVRHDDFNRFADATTVRASAVAHLSNRVSFHGSYGEGIAQPTFFDLFGFFPGSFIGNAALQPERSRAFELGGGWQGDRIALSATVFQSTLTDEIISVFDPATFLSSTGNASGESDRRGMELAVRWKPIPALNLDANYTFLDAEDQQVSGGLQLREVRRPRHSANIAADYRRGQLTLGGALSYVGKRQDTDFDLFPAQSVKLNDYVLASLRISFAVTEQLEVFIRGSNLFDEEYQDVVGYATPGRALYTGLRLRLGG